MSTIIPQNELCRRAVRWINDMRAEKPQKDLYGLIDEAGMRFNLGPQDSAFLLNFFRKEKNGQEK